MSRAVLRAHLGCAALVFASHSALAVGTHGTMHLRGLTSSPVGYVELCRRLPEQCVVERQVRDFALTQARLSQLADVNLEINRRVVAVTDQQLYGVPELWTMPTKSGDCEDYVLLKRKRLMELGWPSGALLITVVFDEKREGHAVLIIRTGESDLVLDNKTDQIMSWEMTSYTYVKRQSESDPNQWVAIGDDRAGRPASTASKR